MMWKVTVTVLFASIVMIKTFGQPSRKVQKSTACPNDRLELSCPDDHVILVSDVHAGYRETGTPSAGRQHSKCSFHTSDCLWSLPSEYIKAKTKCEGKENCDLTPASGIIQSVCSGQLQYVLIQYICVQNVRDYEYSISRCSGDYFDVQMCPLGSAVRIASAYYYTGKKDDDECELGNFWHEIGLTSDIFGYMSDHCNGKQACAGVVAVNGTFSLLFGSHDISAVKIYYTCEIESTLVSVSKCGYNTFDDIYCSEAGKVISIVNAFYGDFGTGRCTEHRNFDLGCQENIIGEYLDRIIEKCDSKSMCDRLVAKRNMRSKRCAGGGWNTQTDYVTLVYKCVYRDNKTQSSIKQNDDEVSSFGPGSTDTPNTKYESTVTITSTVCVVVFVLAVLVVVAVSLLMKRYYTRPAMPTCVEAHYGQKTQCNSDETTRATWLNRNIAMNDSSSNPQAASLTVRTDVSGRNLDPDRNQESRMEADEVNREYLEPIRQTIKNDDSFAEYEDVSAREYLELIDDGVQGNPNLKSVKRQSASGEYSEIP